MLELSDSPMTKSSLFARDALDPTVAYHNLAFPMACSVHLCESHNQLTEIINVQNKPINTWFPAVNYSANRYCEPTMIDSYKLSP